MEVLFKRLDNLDISKSECCMSGRFIRAFLERSLFITDELLPSIESSFDCSSFRAKVMKLYTSKYESEKQYYQDKVQDLGGTLDAIKFYKPLIDRAEDRLKITDFYELIKSIENEYIEYTGFEEIYNNTYKNIHGEEDKSYISNNYKFLVIGGLLYDHYKSIKGRCDMLNMVYSSYVHKEYQDIGIDINETDNQFLKYNLLSLNEHIEILNDKDSRTIRDKRINKYFWIPVTKKLLSSFENFVTLNFVSDISFRVDYISEAVPAMEEMEHGSALKIDVSDLPEVSKFYSIDNYDDSLWIRHDQEKKSLTFEETLDDFEVMNHDVVTQVIHLEYINLAGEYLITHLDHEYIVYTLDDYSERLCKPAKKGYKKIKSFKIDNARIPFMFKKDGEYFLYQVLDSYLVNKELVSEYFSKI